MTANNKRYVLGFTREYYTLWTVIDVVRYGRGYVLNGQFMGTVYEEEKFTYVQNLSKDHDSAIKKITRLSQKSNIPFFEDLSIRGEHRSFTRLVSEVNTVKKDVFRFTFGKLFGQDIRECTDVWQINRAYEREESPRTRVIARKRLIELGELVPFKWSVSERHEDLDKYNSETGERVYYTTTRHFNYGTPLQKQRYEEKMAENEKSGHFFKNGERVVIEVKQNKMFSFESAFGTAYVQTLQTREGQLVKYVGTSPVMFEEDEYIKIKGTVKHTEYQNQKETKLQRIKIV